MRRRLLCLVLAGLALPSVLESQSGPGVDTSLGIAIPVGPFNSSVVPDAQTNPGLGFAVQLLFPVGGWRAVYLGFAENRFACGGAACGGAGRIVSTAWRVGAHLAPPAWRVAPYLRLGMVFDRSEVDFVEGQNPRRRVSELAFGPEVGAGLAVRVATRLTLLPGVGWTRVDADFPGLRALRMRYVVVGFTLHMAF